MTKMEKLFQVFDKTSEMIQRDANITYLEALVVAGEHLFQQEVPSSIHNESEKRLGDLYQSIDVDQMGPEDIRKAFQLAVLKGMRSATQPHHEMTPDAVALFMSYLVNKVTKDQVSFSLLDPAVGSGNLLMAVLNGSPAQVSSFAVDVDDLLLRLAFVNANLQKKETQFFHQDALRPLFLDPVDVIICDLPVGSYPNDETASGYELKAETGHSYVHHLFIEQCIRYVKEDGFLFFLIPNGLFEGEMAKALKKFIYEQAVIQGVLQLPMTLFHQEKHAKSILMMQKKGPHAIIPSQVLLANLPSFSKREALQHMIRKIDAWFQKEWEKLKQKPSTLK